MAETLCNMLKYGGEEVEPDWFNTVYAGSSGATYKFTRTLKWVYVCYATNGNSGTYTGKGTKTRAYTGTYMYIERIENVSANETFKAPELSFGSGAYYRTFMFFLGKKSV